MAGLCGGSPARRLSPPTLTQAPGKGQVSQLRVPPEAALNEGLQTFILGDAECLTCVLRPLLYRITRCDRVVESLARLLDRLSDIVGVNLCESLLTCLGRRAIGAPAASAAVVCGAVVPSPAGVGEDSSCPGCGRLRGSSNAGRQSASGHRQPKQSDEKRLRLTPMISASQAAASHPASGVNSWPASYHRTVVGSLPPS